MEGGVKYDGDGSYDSSSEYSDVNSFLVDSYHGTLSDFDFDFCETEALVSVSENHFDDDVDEEVEWYVNYEVENN